MATEGVTRAPAWVRQRPEPPVPHAVLAMVLFIICEALFFAGLIASFVIGESVNPASWPPPGQPRLPVEVTGVNTAILLLSGVFLVLASRARTSGAAGFTRWLAVAAMLGAVFLVVQGFEWLGLIREGLTLSYSTHASFFYVLVGMHALHVVVALGLLLRAVWLASRQRLSRGAFAVAQMFWAFVVLVWPVLYVLVYLL
ncbi:MAG: heme-copper oxidase subunit III [Candidatus Sericytochromatia bacterium]|nr:heme-copper oxidase subunit III [Candidatus Sericytochromatia bacterium]